MKKTNESKRQSYLGLSYRENMSVHKVSIMIDYKCASYRQQKQLAVRDAYTTMQAGSNGADHGT